jgi:hypothetical protein
MDTKQDKTRKDKTRQDTTHLPGPQTTGEHAQMLARRFHSAERDNLVAPPQPHKQELEETVDDKGLVHLPHDVHVDVEFGEPQACPCFQTVHRYHQNYSGRVEVVVWYGVCVC